MYEYRYHENKIHGEPDFPFHIYPVEHQAGTSCILPIHWHNEMEIIHLAEGNAVFRIESREYAVRAGDTLIVHPGELHSGDGIPGGDIRYFAIVFHFDWLSSLQPDRIQQRYLNPVAQGTVRLPSMLSAADERHAPLTDLVRQMLICHERRPPAWEMSLKALLLMLIAELYCRGLTLRAGEAPKRGLRYQQQIKRVLAYMEEHADDKPDLDRLAAVLSMSRSHFCTFFKTQTGMRPMEYLNYIRVNKAAQLLRTGACSVLEAALESGFQNASYFAKWFKTFMHTTPSEYRSRYASGL
jgi:Transcriptional regulator containing an amidase domain and an AraC-type DNA-binding HTH domain